MDLVAAKLEPGSWISKIRSLFIDAQAKHSTIESEGTFEV
jgi:hypothetical protein